MTAWIDADCVATGLLQGFPDDSVPGALAIARHRLGRRDAVVVTRGLVTAPAATCTVRGVTRIYLRPRLPPRLRRWCILHEVAEIELRALGYDEPDVERQAQAVTAALVAPRRPYLRALRHFGEALASLADAFLTTQTSVALRLAETTGRPVAVVAPARVYAHGGDEEYAWPHAEALRRASKRPPEGVRKVRLSDDRRRVALLA